TVHHRYDTPLGAVMKGAMAGLAGTVVMTYAMKTVPTLMQSTQAKGTRPARRQSDGESLEPPAQLARKVGSEVLEQPVDAEQAKEIGQGIHWAYGMSWGVLFGIIQGTLWLSPLKFGVLLGTLVWAVGPNWLVPLMKIGPEPSKQPTEQTVMSWAFHALFGVVTALSFSAMEGEI
ncbi:MAG TPA: DUF1440 domain-containing protein, partial [Chloroflexota bacterium]|nr:DUF1440 domain-containing protein [Chloroflexota bacterium]